MPARALTGRSLLVIAVVLLAAVLVAPTLRVFLNQELEMNAVRADIAEQERQRDEREERIRRWDDPEYVKQQARERLELVRPGETLYTVTGVDELPEQDPETSSVDENPVNERLPWAEGLWDSVVRAGTE
ncbi:septum formation initiator family protein [uncultured Micrococcus sp.]|uniref:FtsB family cell division protein n=1 Tax=uncultured Micrococcus sp. TaxID=114051 RepID=UPI00259A8EC5|nr:septum formation initiator family protein [uncultured Micrococcus sp.]